MEYLCGCLYKNSVKKDRNISTRDRLSNYHRESPKALLDKPQIELFSSANGSKFLSGQYSESEVYVFFLGPINGIWKDSYTGFDLETPNVSAKYVLDFYLKNGVADLGKLIGQFSLAIIDNRNETKVFLLGDSTGMRSWFVSDEGDRFLFGTHLSSVAVISQAAKINQTYEDFFLTYGFIPFSKTVFEGVEVVPTGMFLETGIEDGGKNYSYKLLTKPEQIAENLDSLSLDEMVDKLDEVFLSSLASQIPSGQKNVAVLLGGFDSALVASGLARLGKQVHTYSFFYEDESFNQPHTDTLAKFLGNKHSWIKVDEKVILEGLNHFSENFNYPTNWLNYLVQTNHLGKKIKEDGNDFVYTGDGCDVAFMGYPRTHFVAHWVKSINRLIPKFLIGSVIGLIEAFRIELLTGRPSRVLVGLLRNSMFRSDLRGFINFRIFDESSVRLLRKKKIVPTQTNEMILTKLLQTGANLSIDRKAYLGKALQSPNKAKIIGTSDTNGLVIQGPYLHPILKNFAMRIPDSMLRPKGNTKNSTIGKYVLSLMAETKKYLPEEIIYQRKVAAVDAPVDTWYKKYLKKDISKLILDNCPFEVNEKYLNNLFQQKSIEEFYRNKISSDTITTHELSLLATYSSFAKFGKEV
ncbi:asparagine synthase-related protein [Leptospira koniambonensis]|uniref:asparagine synthase-related protein n=1 Tax=Leptospira koniambonensis TaxID=2484950 RepID=UPI003EB86CCA